MHRLQQSLGLEEPLEVRVGVETGEAATGAMRSLVRQLAAVPLASIAPEDFADFLIGGFSPPEGRLARGFKPPAFSRFLFQSAVKSAESF